MAGKSTEIIEIDMEEIECMVCGEDIPESRMKKCPKCEMDICQSCMKKWL